MATKKKAAPRGGTKRSARPAAAKARAAKASISRSMMSDQTIQVLVICFTFLSIIFAIEAYWRYW